jgi:hypothetical protein
MAQESTSNFPLVPFDGQEFIDAFRMKWVYDGSVKCWKRVGTVPNIPVASEVQSGLLSRRFKQILDSIPSKGGHFGILARPLLSVVPQNFPTKLKDKVFSAVKNEAGSVVFGRAPKNGDTYDESVFEGNFLRFTKGPLRNRDFLIFTNDEESLTLQGDASEARLDDEFVVFDPLEANEHGVIMGDIELISDTLDITCVDNMGRPITVAQDCNLDYKDCDGGAQAPGLDVKVAEKVIESFCVELRSCKGPKGDKGAKGETGKDGTGDGPTGEMGDPGQDAPDIGHKFTGIKFIDSEDVYDSAVIGLELDADNGKLHVLKAKMAVPDDDTPANQVITSPINRTIDWTDDEFGYTLLKPMNDPIETKKADDADVTMAVFPSGYEIQSTGLPTDIEKSRLTQFNSVTLTSLLDRAIAYFQDRLTAIDEDYDRQIKEFMEEKDAKARAILAGLAQDLAECEWELPIEFCLGITPDDCRDPDPDGDGDGGDGGGGEPPTPWPNPGDVPRFPPPPHKIPAPGPTPVPGGGGTPSKGTPGTIVEADPPPPPVPTPAPTPAPTVEPGQKKLVYSGAFAWQGNIDLPDNMALAIRYRSGAFRTPSSAYFISPNSTSSEEGLIMTEWREGVGTFNPKAFLAIQSYDPHDLNAIEQAYREGGYEGKTTLIFGGNDPIGRLYFQIWARENLLLEDPGMPVMLDIFIIYDPADPPPGVPVTTNVVVNKGGAPGPASTDPTVNASDPAVAQEGVATGITVYGSNFVDGATIEVLGNTSVTVSGVTFVSDTQLTCDVNISADPAFPAPNSYDILVINPDGGNGVGTGLISSFV